MCVWCAFTHVCLCSRIRACLHVYMCAMTLAHWRVCLVRSGSKKDSLPVEFLKGAAPTMKNKVKALSDSKMTKRVLMGMNLKVNHPVLNNYQASPPPYFPSQP